MIAWQTILCWALMPLLFIAQVNAQSNWTDKSPHKTDFITVNGVRLHYLDWGGKGDAILFLHGSGDTPHIYDDLAPNFTNQFRALGLTRRGHGQSEQPVSGYDTATRVEDIRQFLDALKVPRAIVVGHSAAGGELTMLAGAHPDRVIKLVYLDAIFDIDPKFLEQIPAELFDIDMRSLDSARRSLKPTKSNWSEALEASLREQFSSDGMTYLNVETGRAVGAMIQGDARQDYTKIKSPALSFAVVGIHSNMASQLKALPEERRKIVDNFLSIFKHRQEKEIERFHKELPTGRVVVFTNADHHCFIDKESEVVREMRVFLGK